MKYEYVSEILGRIGRAKTRKLKKEILEENKNNKTLRFLLQGTFDPSIKWSVKDIPKYKGSDKPIEFCDLNLQTAVNKCSIFVEGHPKAGNLQLKKATEILNEILETMHPNESKVFEGMLKKKQKTKGLTAKLVLEVFPDLYRKV